MFILLLAVIAIVCLCTFIMNVVGFSSTDDWKKGKTEEQIKFMEDIFKYGA